MARPLDEVAHLHGLTSERIEALVAARDPEGRLDRHLLGTVLADVLEAALPDFMKAESAGAGGAAAAAELRRESSAAAAQPVKFRGQTLTRMTMRQLLELTQDAGYADGWICDGCNTHTSVAGENTEAMFLCHGDVEPNNPLGINAFDLCEGCAADIPAAESRYKTQVAAKAEQERQAFREQWRRQQAQEGGRRRSGGAMSSARDDWDFGGRAYAMMLFPHSGRHGFDQIEPDATVLTPSKDVVVAMLKRETELRNDRETQELLDKIQNDPDEQDGQEQEVKDNETVEGKEEKEEKEEEEKEEKEPETLEEARAIIASLRAQLSAASLAEQQQEEQDKEQQAQEEEEVAALSEAKCDREVFEGIKARVVKEFGLGPEYVDVLNSAVARFPGDPDIVASANYIKYNRARQGKLQVGDVVPMENIQLASLEGELSSLRQHLATDSRPVAIVAGSITWPPFKAACPWLKQQAAASGATVRWLVVYIQEAHASDEWPVGDLTSVTTQPKSLSHRRELARTAHEDLLGGSVEVLVDDMDNSFQDAMACWPIRMFVLDPSSGALRFKAQPDLSPDVYGYRLDSLSDWLAANVQA